MCQLIHFLYNFFFYERDFIFPKLQKYLRLTGEDLANFLRIRVCMTGQLDRWVKFVAGQTAFLARKLIVCWPAIILSPALTN